MTNTPHSSARHLLAVLAIVLASIGLSLLLPLPDSRTLPGDQVPEVVKHLPGAGEEVEPTAPIQVLFDQPMERASTEAAFVLTPQIPGTFHWDATSTTLQFTPRGEGFSPNTLYQVALRDTATSLTGHTLVEPIRFAFCASDALEVTQVMPISDTNGVDLQADVTVMFNRPVVALTTLAQQSTLPQPININPPLAGSGEWLNTSIYVFHPQRPLTTNTTYTVTVKDGLTDVTDTVLRHAYQWSFTTRPPGLIYAAPGDGAVNVWPGRALEVRFAQPMDRASVEAALALHASSGQNVTGTFNWISDTLIFTPTHWLGRGTPYTWQFNGVVRSADGGHLD